MYYTVVHNVHLTLKIQLAPLNEGYSQKHSTKFGNQWNLKGSVPMLDLKEIVVPPSTNIHKIKLWCSK